MPASATHKSFTVQFNVQKERQRKPICIAISVELLVSRRSGMTRGIEGSQSFTCHPHVYPQVGLAIPAFTPQPQSVTALWLVLISRRAEGRIQSW